jgi:outer membrane protein OmpA-like peptidoglycan-associated protein
MRHDPRPAIALATLAAALASGCGPKRRATTPSRAGEAVVVLLPDTPGGTVGRIRVTNPVGAVDLSAARASTSVVATEAPAPVTRLSEADVKRLFGEALAALPPPARRFTLHFQFESDELTEQARAIVPDILETVKERDFPDVVIVGHTDTTGSEEANYALALKRATMVRTLLVHAGLDTTLIDVASHGERDPLIKTGDNVAEPRNRRVEIAVR